MIIIIFNSFLLSVPINLTDAERESGNNDPTHNVGIFFGKMDKNVRLAFQKFNTVAKNQYTVIEDFFQLKDFKAIFVFAHGNEYGLVTSKKIVSWFEFSNYFKSENIQTELIYLVACNGYSLKNLCHQILQSQE